LGGTSRSEQLAEFIDCEASILDDPRHSNGINGVMPWNRNLSNAVAHDDVLPLSQDTEARPLKCSNGLKVINTGQLRHN
jgi:hypothetical protein